MSYAMYIFINTDLKMKAGKWGAQVGHGVQYIIENLKNQSKETIEIYDQWNIEGRRKIILKATEEEMNFLHNSYPSMKVHDAGFNHVPVNSFTCLALYPKIHDESFRNFKLM